jgi:hypothetical protein
MVGPARDVARALTESASRRLNEAKFRLGGAWLPITAVGRLIQGGFDD